MEFSSSSNRRLLLQKEEGNFPLSMPPLSHSQNKRGPNASSLPPQSSAFQFQSPLQVSVRSVFSSSVAYAFLILLTTFAVIGFVFLYFRRFASDRTYPFSSHGEKNEMNASEAKKSLPVISRNRETIQQAAEECAICLEEFGEGDAVKVIPNCKHMFHPQCIDSWLDKHVTCPVCRCSELLSCPVTAESGGGGELVGLVSVRRQEQEVIPNLD